MLVVLSGVLPTDVRRVFPPVVRRVLAAVLRVLNAHPVLDVAMVSSPQVGRGYHTTSMVDNQTHTEVGSSALRMLSQPTNQPLNFLFCLGICLVGNQIKCPT
jgi:hypothetical protein